MNKKTTRTLICLTLSLLLSACAGTRLMQAPDTARGDYLKEEYMVGNWCTDQELTSEKNQEAGHSGQTNMAPLYWNFLEGGRWQVSNYGGWLYQGHGKWGLKSGARQTLVLESPETNPVEYHAGFKDGSMYLEDKAGKFLVLSECE